MYFLGIVCLKADSSVHCCGRQWKMWWNRDVDVVRGC